MGESILAAEYLKQLDALLEALDKPHRWSDDIYYTTRSLVLHAQGKLQNACNELAKVQDKDALLCLSVRAKLALAKGESAEAEQLLRKHLGLAGKWSSTHRPDLIEQVLELAESLFGLTNYDEAFSVLEEARAIARDFALPATTAWRKVLREWLHRAERLGRTDAVASLEAAVHEAESLPEQAITVSPKLRVQPPTL
jgi:tetratricopeptide (TPR) repeat protein